MSDREQLSHLIWRDEGDGGGAGSGAGAAMKRGNENADMMFEREQNMNSGMKTNRKDRKWTQKIQKQHEEE